MFRGVPSIRVTALHSSVLLARVLVRRWTNRAAGLVFGTTTLVLSACSDPAGPGGAGRGPRVAFREGSGSRAHLASVRLDGTGYRVLTPPEHTVENFAVSPRGDAIAYSISNRVLFNDDQFFLVADTGGTPRPVLAGATCGFYHSRWSPDGSRLSANCLSKIATLDLRAAGGTKVVSSFGTAIVYSDLAWSPDLSRIAMAEPGAVRVLDAGGTQVSRTVIPSAWLSSFSSEPLWVSWSPDGRTVVAVAGWNLVLVPADGSGARQLTRGVAGEGFQGVRFAAPVWSPDGAYIVAFSSGVGEAVVVRVSDGTIVGRLPASMHGFPSWSPDGARVVYAAVGRANGTSVGAITIGNPDGSDVRVLYRGDDSLADAQWVP